MRTLGALSLLLSSCLMLSAEPGKGKIPPRYRVDVDLEKYPQKTPQETLKSVLTAIENKQIDYLLAHLADPEFVDKKVAQASGDSKDDAKITLAFGRLIKATSEHFQEDPARIKELYRFAKDGEWKTGEKSASVRHKTIPTRRVFFKKIQDRWFLEDRDK